jgi:O-antigen/teichoic acid export membrane protein
MKKNILLNFITRFGAALLNLLISILVSRELGAEVKGEHSLFIASVALLQLFTNLLGGPSLVYLSSRHNHRQLARLSGTWTTAVVLLAWAILLNTELMPQKYAFSILGSSVLFGWWSNLSFLLLGKEKNRAFNMLQLLHPLVTALLLTAGLFLFKMGLEAFAYGYMLGQLINFFMAAYLMRKVKSRDPEPLKELIRIIYKHGFFIQLANFTQFLNYRLLYFLIDHFFGRAFLGVYSNAQSLAESVWMVTRSISTVQLSRISNCPDDASNRKITRQYVSVSFIISLVCLVPLLVLPSSFFTFLFGKGFEDTGALLFLLAPGILFLSVSNIFAHYFAGSGKNKVNFTGSFINLLCLTGVFYVLLPHAGPATAPISATLAYGAALTYHYLMFRRK